MKTKISLLILMALFLTGCATCDKKVVDLESRVNTLESKCGITAEKEAIAPATVESAVSTESATTPQIVVPETPTKKDIQTSLKNAGFYQGELDGKFGPRTKKAVEEFQAANELKSDGKVGPNTWDKLKNHYSPIEAEATQTK